MTPERWRLVEDLCQRALDLAPEARQAFLAAALGDDAVLGCEVEALLAHETRTAGPLDLPIGALAGAALAAADDAHVGRAVGRYVIEARIGAGGMGAVYRARDLDLNRAVAVKLLLPAMAASHDSTRRFEQEARAVATLNHPNIVAVYDVGLAGEPYLVTELLDGETLRTALEHGPLPVATALNYATQIAAGLGAAHAKGVVHRDVKPGNLFVTRDGVMKLLDFGVAKLNAPNADHAPAPLQTGPQMVLGTAGYIAPEVLRGHPADARADVFSLGVVLYEMLTGKAPFRRTTSAATRAASLDDDVPNPSATDSTIPSRVGRIVKRCLEKDPAQRFQSAAEVGRALQSAALPPWLWRYAAAAVAALLAVGLAVAVGRSSPEPAAVMRLSIMPPEGVLPGLGTAISNDGQRIAFAATDGAGLTRVWVRSLYEGEARPLEGTDGAMFPFWAPDDARVGFFAGGKLKTVAVAGGAPLVVCDAPIGRGGTWAGDTIVFAPFTQGTALNRVPAWGGVATPVTQIDGSGSEGSHRFPQFLPDGRHFLYEATSPFGEMRGTVYVGSIDDARTRTRLFDTTAAAGFAPPNHLLFVRDGTLWTQTLDLRTHRLSGEPAAIATDVQVARIYGYPNFTASTSGVVQYQPRHTTASQLVWRDTAGTVLGTVGPPAEFLDVALAPNSESVAAVVRDELNGRMSLRVLDIDSGVFAPLGPPDVDAWSPVWAPDGTRVAFASNRASRADIYLAPRDRSADPELLLKIGLADSGPGHWGPDGRYMVLHKNEPQLASTIWLMPMREQGPVLPIVRSGNAYDSQISPDGRWVAYSAEDATRREVFVQRIPNPSDRRRISTAGGIRPRWSHDGTALYYVAGDRRMMTVAVDPATGTLGPARALFDTYPTDPGGSPLLYEVARDGRILMVRPRPAARVSQSSIVVNWPTLLQK